MRSKLAVALVACMVGCGCVPGGNDSDDSTDSGRDSGVLDSGFTEYESICGDKICDADEQGICLADCPPGILWCPSPVGPFSCGPDATSCCWNPSCGCCTDPNPVCTTDGCCTDGTGTI